jgi:multiple sugar transport system substrate-binding protein
MSTRSLLSRIPLAVGLAAAVLVAAACSSAPTNTGSVTGPVTLNFWTWVPGIQKTVNLYEKTHPNVKINVVNTGGAAGEYPKLETALKAGSGVPDLVQIGRETLPSFVATKSLVDLSQYGANALKPKFYTAAWAQATFSGHIYEIPQDYGPIVMFYRKDIFDKLHLTPPKTWAEFAADSQKVHAANPNTYMTFVDPSGSVDAQTSLWQAGSRPFSVQGTTLSINLQDAGATKWANYWTPLIKNNLVQLAASYTNAWYHALANGTYATWIVGAWAPTFMQSVIPQTKGLWRVAPVPQWEAGANVTAEDASGTAVTVQSKYPAAAAAFAIWLNSNRTSTQSLVSNSFLFPATTELADAPTFQSATDPFLGGQAANQVYVSASENVATGWQWLPIQTYANSVFKDTVGEVMSKGGNLNDGLKAWEARLIAYARSEGFTVNGS